MCVYFNNIIFKTHFLKKKNQSRDICHVKVLVHPKFKILSLITLPHNNACAAPHLRAEECTCMHCGTLHNGEICSL